MYEPNTDAASQSSAIGADLITLGVYAFFGIVVMALIVRVVVGLVKRRPGSIREALRPIADSGAAQSKAFGWAPPPGSGHDGQDSVNDQSEPKDQSRGSRSPTDDGSSPGREERIGDN